jgi:hypothetical protein
MTKLTYGDGLLQTQQGKLSNGLRCLTITRLAEPRPINSTPRVWENETEEDSVDCILAFKNLDGARTLQDELNELIAIWSREEGKKV